jgi:hypothetical protein
MPVFVKDVIDDLKDFGRNPTKYPKLPMRGLEISPMVGIKSLNFRGTVKGSSGKNYIATCQFHKVDYDSNENEDIKEPIDVKGKKVFYAKPSMSLNPVMVKCTCPDFRFRFEKPLYDDKGLIGMWNRYTKVPGSNRGPVNPENHLGLCKHLYSFVNKLIAQSYIIK